MKAQTTPSKTFEDLVVWQKSRELNILIYQLTKHFPADERFDLVSQMRRASISVSSNIAEGFGRRQPKDKEHFYTMALGSLSELLSQLLVSRDLNYIDNEMLEVGREKLIETRKLLSALLTTHRS